MGKYLTKRSQPEGNEVGPWRELEFFFLLVSCVLLSPGKEPAFPCALAILGILLRALLSLQTMDLN